MASVLDFLEQKYLKKKLWFSIKEYGYQYFKLNKHPSTGRIDTMSCLLLLSGCTMSGDIYRTIHASNENKMIERCFIDLFTTEFQYLLGSAFRTTPSLLIREMKRQSDFKRGVVLRHRHGHLLAGL